MEKTETTEQTFKILELEEQLNGARQQISVLNNLIEQIKIAVDEGDEVKIVRLLE